MAAARVRFRGRGAEINLEGVGGGGGLLRLRVDVGGLNFGFERRYLRDDTGARRSAIHQPLRAVQLHPCGVQKRGCEGGFSGGRAFPTPAAPTGTEVPRSCETDPPPVTTIGL